MKKLLGLILGLSLVTGCGQMTDQERLDTASKNLQEAKNYELKMEVEAKMSVDGIDASTTINGVVETDIENKTAKTLMEVSMLGMTMKIEGYSVEESGNTITYTKNPLGNEWEKQIEKTEKTENINLEGLKLSKVLKSDISGTNKYQIELSKKQVEEMTGSFQSIATEYELTDNIVVYAYINTKTNQLVKMEFDLASAVVGENKPEVLRAVMSFDKINKLSKINIPEEVINNAKEQ